MIKQCITGITIGIIITLFVAQFDFWVQEQIGEYVKHTMGELFNCSVSGKLRSINFLMPEIIFDDFYVCEKTDENPQWSWHVKKYVTGFSWLSTLLSGSIQFWVDINGVHIKSAVNDDGIAIMPHIHELMTPVDLPMLLTSIHVSHGVFDLDGQGFTSHIKWNGSSRKIGEKFCSHFCIIDGSVHSKERKLLDALHGTIDIDSQDLNNTISYSMRIDTQADLNKLSDHPTCFFTGKWEKTHGRFSIQSIDQSLMVSPIVITEKNNKRWLETTISFPISYALYLATNSSIPISGNVTVQIKGTFDEPAFLDAHIALEDIKHWLLTDVAVATCSIHKRKKDWAGKIAIRAPGVSSFIGSCGWNEENKKGNIHLTNSQTMSIPYNPYWMIKPNAFIFKTDIDNALITSSYSCNAINNLLSSAIKSIGSIKTDLNSKKIYGSGRVHDHRYTVEADLTAFPYIKQFTFYDPYKKPLLLVKQKGSGLSMEVEFPFVQSALSRFCKYDLHGEGTMHFDLRMIDKKLYAGLRLCDGTIRLPHTFNFMNAFSAQLITDLETNQCIVKDVYCELHTGSIRIPKATIHLENGALSFAHVPLIFDRCLINLKQDLFAMVSGGLLFSKQTKESLPAIKGNLILDRAQIKENLFSDLFQKKLLQATSMIPNVRGVDCECDLTIVTKDVVRVDTDFLQANARINLSIKKNVMEPEITGSIDLLSGTLGFPYKPLYINKGSLTFLAEQPLNPLVELVAKNKIKQHNLSLHVTGSLQDHLVLLESTPPLTEEQIVGLLLAGSHEESLSNVIPTLLVQNIANLIFSAHPSTILDRYVKPWMKHINVQLVPLLSEQAGRGGLRGAFSHLIKRSRSIRRWTSSDRQLYYRLPVGR